MSNQPTYTDRTTQAEGYLSSGFWVLQRTHDAGLLFATIPTASALLSWYEDASISEGEEGRDFSRCVVAFCRPWEDLRAEADAEEADRKEAAQ